jgi:hypothetical protein
MTKQIRIAALGVPDDYRTSLVPLIIQKAGFHIEWTAASRADLVIFGAFFKAEKPFRWIPKPLRPAASALNKRLASSYRPLTLFHTSENLQHDHIPCDYALSFDLSVEGARHCRLPYWMELVNWNHEGITGNANPRFGALLELDRLMQALGSKFLQKSRRVALFGSHLREPRHTLLREVSKRLPVQGYGAAFDTKILHHSQSGFLKKDVLQDFAFNLCPENSMYPGYYTEKIPEAFMADCLPLSWTDSNVRCDFNPKAFINLADMMAEGFEGLEELLLSETHLKQYSEHALLSTKPSLQNVKDFVHEIVKIAVT